MYIHTRIVYIQISVSAARPKRRMPLTTCTTPSFMAVCKGASGKYHGENKGWDNKGCWDLWQLTIF